MNSLLNIFQWPGIRGWVEILILAAVIYYILASFRGTRGAAVLTGIAVVLTMLTVLIRLFNLDVLYWMMQKMLVYAAIALVVIFQPEIRRGLSRLGRRASLNAIKTHRETAEAVTQAALMLAERKIGALIAIEREIGTRGLQETGVWLRAEVSAELLGTLFFPGTPLHDGGVVISGGKIMAAGCLFPLSQRGELSRRLGTRHRAAIGITEETDALVVVVSEETGVISIAYNGRLRRGLDEERLRRTIHAILGKHRRGPLSLKPELGFDPMEGFSEE